MSSPSPLPPPIDHRTFRLTTRLTIAGGLTLVAVICGLMILYMFVFHYCYHQRLRVADGGTESSQIWGAVAEVAGGQKAVEEMGLREVKRGEIGDCDGRLCAICIEEFGEEEICGVIENCGHFFHKDCIQRWVRIERNCPLCRCFVDKLL